MAIYLRNEQGQFAYLNHPTLKGDKGEKGDRGEQGLPGENGRDGVTPNLQVGSVTTLEPEQQATVTIGGTKENPVLDFGIPRGKDGQGGNGMQEHSHFNKTIIDGLEECNGILHFNGIEVGGQNRVDTEAVKKILNDLTIKPSIIMEYAQNRVINYRYSYDYNFHSALGFAFNAISTCALIDASSVIGKQVALEVKIKVGYRNCADLKGKIFTLNLWQSDENAVNNGLGEQLNAVNFVMPSNEIELEHSFTITPRKKYLKINWYPSNLGYSSIDDVNLSETAMFSFCIDGNLTEVLKTGGFFIDERCTVTDNKISDNLESDLDTEGLYLNGLKVLMDNNQSLEDALLKLKNQGLSEESVHFSHLSPDLKSMYITRKTSAVSNARTIAYTKKANLKFTAMKNSGWAQVRIPLDLTNYPNGDVTIDIESYWKSKDGSTVRDGTAFYNTVYTCADNGSTQGLPVIIKDFPNLNVFTKNEAYYKGSVTINKTPNTKYVNIYTIPRGNASEVPHNAELGVSLSVNGKKLTHFEFKEGMIGDIVEVSYIGVVEGDIPSTPDGLYMNGNFIDVDGYLLPDVINALMSNIGAGGGNTSNPPHHPWKGKKANFLGDSITQGVGTSRTYHQYLQSSLGLVASRNYGISGSSITDRNTPMHSRCLTMDDDADIVFVFGGTNDFFFAVPLGEWYTLHGTTRNLNKDTSTFRGALNVLCCNLINKYPSKQIILMTPLHRNTFGGQPTEYQTNSIGLYVEDYVNCVVEAGKIHSIPVIDLYSESGLRPSESASCNLYFTSGDKLHPTATGHERIAKLIENKLKIIPVY